MSKDLLKEAIADAKAVRATAIANAKLALEEAFTPKLQSMLSTKIREEFEDEDEDEPEVDVAALAAEAEGEADLEAEPAAEPEEDAEVEIYDEYDENDAPEDELEEADVEGEPSEDDLELEAILRELEAGTEAEEDFPDPTAEDPSLAEDADNEDAEEVTDDDDFDLEEVINALREEEDEDPVAEADTEDDLEEAYATIKFLRSKINEVNLLNAKLLFSNKLFRANNLNESQKLRVIETFDRAASVREVKLVYSTLAESMVGTKGTKSSMTEGLASKSTKSTAPKKSVIVEQNNFSDRMRKLAGLI